MQAPLRYSGKATAIIHRSCLSLEGGIPPTWWPHMAWERTDVVRKRFLWTLARPMVCNFLILALTFLILARCVYN